MRIRKRQTVAANQALGNGTWESVARRYRADGIHAARCSAMQHEVCSRAGTQARWHAPRAVAAPPVRDAPASCGNVRRAALGRPDMDSGGLYSGLWPSPVLEPAPNPPDDGAEPEGVPPDDAGWPAIEAAVTPPLRLAMNAFTSAARC
ncbi:hypothetical protein LMG26296_02202 [Cupriavidus plantarum]|nr:hypothetical protein LMG26296_02202 [Cupriavidus plantarum]SMR84586.1 hypothetical protein SAMN05421735_3374 [Cupriavidus plantarum]